MENLKSKKQDLSSCDQRQGIRQRNGQLHDEQKSEKRYKSIYLKEYLKYCNEHLCDGWLIKFREELSKNKISFEKSQYQNYYTISIFHHSKSFTALTLGVSFTKFTLEIDILNLTQTSQMWIKMQGSNLQLIASGGEGSVYRLFLDSEDTFDNNNQQVAVKIISFKSAKDLHSIIYEYCFNKLFSVLEIGPFMPMNFGFDMLIFDDAILYSMEVCSPFKLKKNDLKNELQRMHSLQIIHGDIKSGNMMWSSVFLKNVFIDFGYSKVLKEQIGYETETRFFGTIGYCSKQMQQLYLKREKGSVDLYYNDVIGLQKSLKKEQEKDQNQLTNFGNKKQTYFRQNMKSVQTIFLYNKRLLYLIYKKDVKGVEEFYVKNKDINLSEMVTSLIQQLDSDAFLDQILMIIAKNYHLTIDQILETKKSLEKGKQSNVQIQTFRMRIKETNEQFNGVMNEVMIFFMLVFGEDLTKKIYHKKLRNLQKLRDFDPSDKNFWIQLTTLYRNTCEKNEEFDQVLEYVKVLLKIESWGNSNPQEIRLFHKAFKIAKVGLQQYGYNIFQIDYEQHARQTEQNKRNMKVLLQSYFEGNINYLDFFDEVLNLHNQRQSISKTDIGYEDYYFVNEFDQIFKKYQLLIKDFNDNKLVQLFKEFFKIPFLFYSFAMCPAFLRFVQRHDQIKRCYQIFVSKINYNNYFVLQKRVQQNTKHILTNGGRFSFMIWQNIRGLIYNDILIEITCNCYKKGFEFLWYYQRIRILLQQLLNFYFGLILKNSNIQLQLIRLLNVIIQVMIKSLIINKQQYKQQYIKLIQYINNKLLIQLQINYNYIIQFYSKLFGNLIILNNYYVIFKTFSIFNQKQFSCFDLKQFVRRYNFRQYLLKNIPELSYCESAQTIKRVKDYYLSLCWKQTKTDPVQFVGLYNISLITQISIQKQKKEILQVLYENDRKDFFKLTLMQVFGKLYRVQKDGDQWINIMKRLIEIGKIQGKVDKIYNCLNLFFFQLHEANQRHTVVIILHLFNAVLCEDFVQQYGFFIAVIKLLLSYINLLENQHLIRLLYKYASFLIVNCNLRVQRVSKLILCKFEYNYDNNYKFHRYLIGSQEQAALLYLCHSTASLLKLFRLLAVRQEKQFIELNQTYLRKLQQTSPLLMTKQSEEKYETILKDYLVFPFELKVCSLNINKKRNTGIKDIIELLNKKLEKIKSKNCLQRVIGKLISCKLQKMIKNNKNEIKKLTLFQDPLSLQWINSLDKISQLVILTMRKDRIQKMIKK